MCVGGGVEFPLSSFVGHCAAGAVFLMWLVLSLQRGWVQEGATEAIIIAMFTDTNTEFLRAKKI